MDLYSLSRNPVIIVIVCTAYLALILWHGRPKKYRKRIFVTNGKLLNSKYAKKAIRRLIRENQEVFDSLARGRDPPKKDKT